MSSEYYLSEIVERKLNVEELGFKIKTGWLFGLGNSICFSVRSLKWYKVKGLRRNQMFTQITPDEALGLLNIKSRKKILFNHDIFFPRELH